MEAIFAILNALQKMFPEGHFDHAVETWMNLQKVKAFLEEHPNLSFTNQGAPPLNPAALCYSPNSSGRYGMYSGIPDGTPYEEVQAAANAVADAEANLAVLATAAEQRSVEEALAELAERVAETVLAEETA